MKSAIITGILGQDGRFLAELLNSKGYKVIGICRQLETSAAQEFRKSNPHIDILARPLDVEQIKHQIIEKYKPDEIYNLGAFSSVSASFKDPISAANETALWALKLFEACRESSIRDSVRIYQAGSSEMFGAPRETPQTEKTPFNPISPYGASKLFAYNLAVQYRQNYGLQMSNGILFNHESPYRSTEYVTRKISSNIAKIKLGKIKKFNLGNIEGRRDWGYAGDYVKAMHLMLQSEFSDDYVICTGISHSVRDFIELALSKADLPINIDKYVEFDRGLERPADNSELVGDYTKAKMHLGWEPRTSFEQLVEIMLEHDLRVNS